MRPSNRPEKTPAEIRAATIETNALLLREQGYSFDEIAEQLKIPRDMVGRAVNRALRAVKKQARETAQDIVDLELLRLDRLYQIAMSHVRAGDLKAIDTAIKIMERRTKYLGLDSAVKMQIQNKPDDLNLKDLPLETLEQIEALIMESQGQEVAGDIDEVIDYGVGDS
jgi:hypothetical protein